LYEGKLLHIELGEETLAAVVQEEIEGGTDSDAVAT
jgi:hypothetical protein